MMMQFENDTNWMEDEKGKSMEKSFFLDLVSRWLACSEEHWIQNMIGIWYTMIYLLCTSGVTEF